MPRPRAARGLLDLRGVRQYSIQGPVAGYPIRLNGTTISILVTWRRNPAGVEVARRDKEFRVASQRAYRICRLLTANTVTGDAIGLLDSMDRTAKHFKKEELASSIKLQESGKLDQFYKSYLELLLEKNVGFTRLRLWIRDPKCNWVPGERSFTVQYSFCSSEAENPVRERTNPYHGCQTKDTSPFTSLTVERALQSLLKETSVFGTADPNCDLLDKNPDSEWAVAPLVKGDQLWGFISGEVDAWDRSNKRMGAGKKIGELQHFALDVIAHTVSSFQPRFLNHLWKNKE